MEVKKMSSKLIKPSTPTPLNLKNYKLSFLDRRHHPSNNAIVLFYEWKPEYSEAQAQAQLEESLAKTLVHFYPLAGRLIRKRNSDSIDCSDQGAEFVEAEALGLDLVSVIGTDEHNHLLPEQYFRVDESQPLLSIQATRFSCGGLALAVSVSQIVFDSSSVATFIAAWSSITTTTKTIITPSFDLPPLLPINDDDSMIVDFGAYYKGKVVVVKKLKFDKATIARLKSKIGKPVSAARAISAAVSKALILLDGVKRGGRSRGFVICQPVDMRERTSTPHVARHACGNFSFLALSRRVEAEGMGMPELSELMGEAVRRCIGNFAEAVAANRHVGDIIVDTEKKLVGACEDPDTNVLIFSNLTTFGSMEADFGWGKPAWTSIAAPQSTISATTLMKDGDGIEAWLHLDFHDDQRHWEFINQVIYNPTLFNSML